MSDIVALAAAAVAADAGLLPADAAPGDRKTTHATMADLPAAGADVLRAVQVRQQAARGHCMCKLVPDADVA